MADLAENAGSDLAADAGNSTPDRRPVRDRADHQWSERESRKAVRQELRAPLVADLEAWMRQQRAKLSRSNDVAKAMDYMLKRWSAFTRFLDPRPHLPV